MKRNRDLARILQHRHGLVLRRDQPALGTALDWLLRQGELVAVLPGVYAAPAVAHLPISRMRAACLRYPDGVLLGGAAARLSYWPDCPQSPIEVATRVQSPARAGFRFTRRRIPPELIVERDGLRYSAPCLTAIDLAGFECADAIDQALRTRAATLAGMSEALALTAHRRGNAERLRLLLDSRNEPWSAAERTSHRLLRGAGIEGWKSNLPIFLNGHLYYLDIAFEKIKLVIEIDGRRHQLDEDLFETDRWRQNALVADGWRVLRFTWAMLRDHPEEFVAAVRAEIA